MIFLATVLIDLVITGCMGWEVCDHILPQCEGNEVDCHRSLPCYNGNCDDMGKCICSNCWTGSQCDQYVDNYEPMFPFSTQHVTLSTEAVGVVFTVSANDDDLVSSCHLESDCPCARPYYSIQEASATHPFQIDHWTGELRISEGEKLQSIKSILLLISVQRYQNESWERNSVNTFTVFIMVSDNNNYESEQNMDESFSELASHRRHKRASETNANVTSIVLNQLNADSTSVVQPGDKFDFQLDIQIASGASTNLYVEIFSLEHITNNSVFALINISVASVGTSLTTSFNLMSQPELTTCDELPDINYRASYNIGNVTAGSGDNVISILFSTVFLNVAPYVVNGSNYSVFAGVSYDSDNFVWIGQTSYEALIPSTQTYRSYMTIDGPETMAIDGYAIFTANVYTVSPNDSYELDVFGFGATVDSYSTGAIILKSVGTNYPLVRSSWLSYPYEKIPSSSENTTMKSKWFISTLVNTDETRTISSTVENLLSLKFVVYSLNNEDLVGTILSIACTLMIGENTIWTNLINMTLTERESTAQATPTSMSLRNTTINVDGVGRTARVYIDIVIPESSYSDILLELTLANPDTAKYISMCDFSTEYGANIPYVAPVTSIVNDTKMTIPLGRVWNSGLIISNVTANTLTVIVMIRAESEATDGQIINIHLDGVQDKNCIVYVQDNDSFNESDVSVVSVSMLDIFNQTSLAPGAESALQLSLRFPPETTFGNLMLEMTSNMANETVKGRICAASVTNIGSKVPCMNKRVINSGVQYNQTNDGGNIDVALMKLGGICINSASPGNSSNTNIEVTVYFEVPVQPDAVSGSYFRFYSGMSSVAASTVWASSVTYNIDTSVTEIMPYEPEIFAYVAQNSPPLIAFNVALINILIKIPPLSRSQYSLRIDGGICTFNVVSVGASFPCVQQEVIQQSCVYDNYNSQSSSYVNASMNFGWVTNLVSTPWISDNSIDDNSIVVSATVKPLGPITCSLIYSGSSKTDTLSLKSISPTPLSDPLASSINVSIFALDGSNIISTPITKVVALQMQFSTYFLTNVTVSFENPNAPSNDYVFCSAAVTLVGANLPCFNATKFNPKFNPALVNRNCSNNITLDLGSICRLPLSKNQSSDSITVEVSVMLLNPSLESVSVTARVTTSNGLTTSDDLLLNVDSNSVGSSTINVTVFPVVSSSNVTLSVGQQAVLKFNVSIPSNNTVPMNVTVRTPSINNRATMTISRVVLIAAGIDVACVKNSSEAILDSVNISTPQKNFAVLDLGYVTNTGLSERRGYSQSYDNHLSFEVEILMGDHPDQLNGTAQMLSLAVGTDVEGSQIVILQRSGTEVPQIIAASSVTNQKLFRKNDMVDARLLLHHSPTSAAEPSVVYIRLLLPVYLNFTGTPSSNVTVDVQYSPVVTIKITTPFYFGQVYDVKFYLVS
ncbi:hypothetical protein CHUAL_004919 [Chamberlinius hualienensis]